MRTTTLFALALFALSAAACAAPVDEPSEPVAADESELRGDVSYVRALAAAAGPSFSLAGTPYEGAVSPVAFTSLPASLRARLEREVDDDTYGGDPERAWRTAEILGAHAIRRDGRLVGHVAELGIVETWAPPWRRGDDEGGVEPSFGSWLYFDARNRLVAEIEWEH